MPAAEASRDPFPPFSFIYFLLIIFLCAILLPVQRPRQDPIADQLNLSGRVRRLHQLVALLPVATQVRQLQVANVRRMTALVYWYDMVNARAERMRKLQRLIHWLTTYTAHVLRL